MTNGRADRLSVKRHAVLVVRLVVEVGGDVTGELMDPLSGQKQQFTDSTHLVEALSDWINTTMSNAAGKSWGASNA